MSAEMTVQRLTLDDNEGVIVNDDFLMTCEEGSIKIYSRKENEQVFESSASFALWELIKGIFK